MFLDQFPMNCRVGLNLGSKASSMQVPTLEFLRHHSSRVTV